MAALVCCAAPAAPTSSVEEMNVAIVPLQPRTILPPQFCQSLAPEAQGLVRLPPQIVSTAKVVRPRAELRVGPGGQYELREVSLVRDAQVVVIGKLGIWRKVLLPQSGDYGWVHAQAISEATLNNAPMNLDMRRLPTVQAAHLIELAQQFPDSNPIKVTIPRGAIFRLIRQDDRAALVWLSETNSVMWLSLKDLP